MSARGTAAMFTPPAAMDPLERALDYPYAAPARSYRFVAGAAVPAAIEAADRAGCLPVLACGSNRAPAQLARKFAGIEGADFAVERVFLADFDSVYAAHISGYGAVAATLQHSPGCRVELFVTWLPPRLMPRMHATEGRGTFYNFVRLDGLDLVGEGGEALSSAYAYAFHAGCLNLAGGPVALAAVPARNRRFRALDEAAVQRAVQAKFGEGGSLEEFVLAAVHDQAVRLAREARLCADAIPFAWPGGSSIVPGDAAA
ncbi:MAG: hypothetical protein KIT16_17930 [Rhodospirillaceae bacterium]|nr:hypothetical protein [Rhodospirillaceae bacterium]